MAISPPALLPRRAAPPAREAIRFPPPLRQPTAQRSHRRLLVPAALLRDCHWRWSEGTAIARSRSIRTGRIARVENSSAANGDHRRKLPEMKRSPGNNTIGRSSFSRAKPDSPGRSCFASSRVTSRDGLRREHMQMDPRDLRKGRAEGNRSSCTPDALAGRNISGGVSIMPRASSAGFHAGKIKRGALSGDGLLGRPAMDLHAANPQTLADRMDFDLLLLVDRARNQSAGHHGPEALHGEHAIDRQPEDSAGIFGGTSAASRASSRFSWSSPVPVLELTGMIGEVAGSRNEPRGTLRPPWSRLREFPHRPDQTWSGP